MPKSSSFSSNDYFQPIFSEIRRSNSSKVIVGSSLRDRRPSSIACSSSSVHDSSESKSSRSRFFSSVISFGSSSSISSKLIYQFSSVFQKYQVSTPRRPEASRKGTQRLDLKFVRYAACPILLMLNNI